MISKNSYKLEKVGIEGRDELRGIILNYLNSTKPGFIVTNKNKETLNYFKKIGRDAEFLDKLPLVLKKAIEIYCSYNYSDINNGFLRKNKGLKIGTNEVCRHMVDYIIYKTVNFYKEGIVQALDLVINQTELNKEIILYKGCDIVQFKELDITTNEELFLCVGQSFNEYGYTSTTSDVGGRFFEENPIIMIIRTQPGVHVANFCGSSLSGAEGEIIIERDIIYTINKIQVIDEKFFVYVDAVPRKSKNLVNIEDIKLTDNEEDLALDKFFREEIICLDKFSSKKK